MPASVRRSVTAAFLVVLAVFGSSRAMAGTPCNSLCSNCLAGNCVTCISGYYIENRTSSCVPCDSGTCKTCDVLGNCLRCVDGYTPYLVLPNGTGTAVVYERATCVQNCPDGTYRHLLTGQCTACPDNCRVCTDSNLCKTCNGGYTLTNLAKNENGGTTVTLLRTCVPSGSAIGGKQGAAAPAGLLAVAATAVAAAAALIA